MLLKNNSTYFPVSLSDANAMPFDIVADGTVVTDAAAPTVNDHQVPLSKSNVPLAV